MAVLSNHLCFIIAGRAYLRVPSVQDFALFSESRIRRMRTHIGLTFAKDNQHCCSLLRRDYVNRWVMEMRTVKDLIDSSLIQLSELNYQTDCQVRSIRWDSSLFLNNIYWMVMPKMGIWDSLPSKWALMRFSRRFPPLFVSRLHIGRSPLFKAWHRNRNVHWIFKWTLLNLDSCLSKVTFHSRIGKY